MLRFGDILLQERDKKHLLQRGVADYLGVSWRTVSAWEKNRAIPTQEEYEKLLEIFPDLPPLPSEDEEEIEPLLSPDLVYRFSLLSEDKRQIIRDTIKALIIACEKSEEPL